MAMLTFEQAYKKFATPAERAIVTATKRVSTKLEQDIRDRAFDAGYAIKGRR